MSGEANGEMADENNKNHLKAVQLKNSGNDKFNRSNYKGAIIDYKKGLLYEQNNPDIHANLSAAYLHLEKYVEAEEYARFSIFLKPQFYKGYMRAAKAAHGKGITRIALKTLEEGLKEVTDPTGIRELTRLQKQYISYLALSSNTEREMSFQSDTYESDDEDYMSEGDLDDDPPAARGEAAARPAKTAKPPPAKKSEELRLPLASKLVRVPRPIAKDCCPLPVPVAASETEAAAIEATVTDVSYTDNVASKGEENKEERDTTPENVKDKEKEKPKQPEDGQNNPAENIQQPESVKKTESVKQSENVQLDKTKGPDNTSHSEKAHNDLEVHNEMHKELSKDANLKSHVMEFREYLKNGSDAFLSGNYRKAVECFKAAKEREDDIDEKQFLIIKYAQCAAHINLNTYDDIVKGIHLLNELMNEKEDNKFSIPTIHIMMAKAYFKLNRFKMALEPLEKLQEILDDHVIFPAYYWPGTNETIVETTPAGLKEALKNLNTQCRMPHKPTAVCRFEHCLKISTHILPSEFIYTSDPDFIGFVRMICEEKCHIEFHISCWKSYKESVCGVSKINDKDFLGRGCLTTDCVNNEGNPSVVTVIEIIGPDGHPKSTVKMETKAVVDSKKAKKRKAKLDDKERDKEKKDKDEKEKISKAKKPKEKKVHDVREDKKTPAVVVDDSKSFFNPLEPPTSSDGASLEKQLEALPELRKINFGRDCDNVWDPMKPFYGRADETEKACLGIFYQNSSDSVEVRDAKDFIFSYFDTTLKEEGPVKMMEIEELWNSASENFFDIKVVLPDIKSICDLLLTSSRFCQMEDYMCLSSQLLEAVDMVADEVSSTLAIIWEEESANGGATKEESQVAPGVTQQSLQSEDESSSDEEYNSGADSDDSDEESSEDDVVVEVTNADEESSEEQFEEAQSCGEPKADEPERPLMSVGPIATDVAGSQWPQPKQKEGISMSDLLRQMHQLKNDFKSAADNTAGDIDIVEPGRRNLEDIEVIHLSDEEAFLAEEISSVNVVKQEPVTNGNVSTITLDSTANGEQEQSESELGNEPEDGKGTENGSIEPHAVQCSSPSSEQQFLETGGAVGESREAAVPVSENCVNFTEDKAPASSDKASQIAVATEECTMQTTATKVNDAFSQTNISGNECSSNADTRKEIVELGVELEQIRLKLMYGNQQCLELTSELDLKNNTIKELKRISQQQREELIEDARKNLVKAKADMQKEMQNLMNSEISKREKEWKKKEDEMSRNMDHLRDMYARAVGESAKHKSDLGIEMKEKNELKKAIAQVKTILNDNEAKLQTMESESKVKTQHLQKMHLQTIRAYWESKINLLSMRCVEKISEMQSWFTMVPPDEVEDLPSWGAIQENILQWSEINKTVQQLKANFQTNYAALDERISAGETVDDLGAKMLPALPAEPTPLPLDRLHREISEKHVKKIAELTSLVGSQQLEIERIKTESASHKPAAQAPVQPPTQLPPPQLPFSPFQHPPPFAPGPPQHSYPAAAPRMQTTAFGSLALQYPYPQMTSMPFGQQNKDFIQTSVPPPSQDTSKVGAPVVKSDVQTLLKESSKLAASFQNTATTANKALDCANSQSPVYSFGASAAVSKPSSIAPPTSSYSTPAFVTPAPMTPPVIRQTASSGAVHNSVKKEDKQPTAVPYNEESRSGSSSTSSTPVPPPIATAPTPDKAKKKKKGKTDAADSKVDFTLMSAPAPAASASASGEDPNSWNVVGHKVKFSAAVAAPAPAPVTKSKNRQKLLERLQQRFRTTSIKDLDDIVKLVREQNNSSLSGLPFDEIEARVGRIITKRLIQKNSTMGLDKFSQAAWGSGAKPQPAHAPHLCLEDCTICLDPMGSDRTKLDCNHEFDTKCIREWLSRDRTCPLCKKFTTMPDEFPAL